MAKKRNSTDDDLEPSTIYLHGYSRLAAAIIARAFADIRRTAEVEEALEAFTWLVYGDGLTLLNLIGFTEFDETDVIQAIGRLTNGRQTTINHRSTTNDSGSNPGIEHEQTKQVSGRTCKRIAPGNQAGC